MSDRTETSRPSTKPGTMTAVMRAAAVEGPRVLRIGVVVDGRVVEERIIKDRATVKVGRGERNQFVIKGEKQPFSFALFERVQDGYQLNWRSGMSGRVKTPDGVHELRRLEAQAVKTSEGFAYGLSEEMRGKVVLGDRTFLFQFVAPPPSQPAPQLPVAVMRGGMGIDWPTTIVAGFSFLVHFLLLGLLYSDWMDPVVDSDIRVRSLVESIKNLPPPPEVEEKQLDKEPDEKKPEEAKPKEPPKQVNKQPKTKPIKAEPSGPPQKMTQTEVAALASELDSLDMGILAANTGKAATANVLSDSDSINTSALDQAASSNVGVSSGGPGGLKVGSAGAAIAAGASGPGLAGVGSTGKTTSETSGTAKKVAGPTGNASLGGTAVAGKVDNASRVVSRMRAGFRACYQRGLASNPDAAGRINLKIKVGPGGEVVGVSAPTSGNIPASVVSCVTARARSARFSPPQGGTAVVSVPITFVAQ